MPLDILQCTGQHPTTKSYSTQNVNGAGVEKPLVTVIDPNQCGPPVQLLRVWLDTVRVFRLFRRMDIQNHVPVIS